MRLAASVATCLAAVVFAATTSAAASLHHHQAPGPRSPPPPLAAVDATPAVTPKKPSWEFVFGSQQTAMTPATTADRVYVPTNTTLYALDARSGQLVWSYEYSAEDAPPNATRIAATAELVVVGTFDRLIAVNPRTGAHAWTYKPGPPTGKLPPRCEGVHPRFGHGGSAKGVYVTVCYAPLVKLSMAGEVMWTAPASSGGALHYASESEQHGLVFFNSYHLTDMYPMYFVAVDARTGAVARQEKYFAGTISLDEGSNLLFNRYNSMTDSEVFITRLTAYELPDMTVRYTLNHIDQHYREMDGAHSISGTALYAMATNNEGLVRPVNFYMFPDVRAVKPTNNIYEPQPSHVLSASFASCSKGLINFGNRSIDGYDEKDGSHAWQYKGVPVAAGALIGSTNTVVAALEDRVVALDF